MINALGLFSGVGGWEVHDAELGIRTTGIEDDRAAADTAEAAGLHVQRQDVTKVTLLPRHGYKILKAGPPCQTFSAAGKGAGRKALDLVLDELAYLVKAARAGSWRDQTEWIRYALFDDKRTGLVLEPLRYILAAVNLKQPFRAIVLEQVPAVLPVWQAYAGVLRELGYSVAAGILHAEQYGVPQTRKRAVLIARLDGEAKLPTPTHSKYHNRTPNRLDEGVPSWVNMAAALGYDEPATMRSNYGTGGDPAARGERDTDKPAPTVTGKIDRNKWLRPTTMPNATVRPVSAPAPTVAFGKDAASFKWVHERPATTVQGDPRLAAPGHRCMTTDCHTDREPESMMTNAVRVTVQEAAVLQTFPADHPWQGTKTQQYQQVGNAIPPLLARAILEQVL